MKAIPFCLVGLVMFFLGHYVGYERAITQKHEKTYTIKLGDIPLIRIGKDGAMTCSRGAVIADAPKELSAIVE